MALEVKRCCTCKNDLEENKFTPGEWNKPSTKRCRECVKAKNKATQSKNSESRSTYQKNYYASNKEKLQAQNNERYRENKDRYSVAAKKWYDENKDRLNRERSENKEKYSYQSWVQRLKRVYGITPEDYNRILEDQGAKCALCGTEDPGSIGNADAIRKVFAVDHCHDSGDIRGLLCHRCNTGLGLFLDNPDALLKAAEYVRACH